MLIERQKPSQADEDTHFEPLPSYLELVQAREEALPDDERPPRPALKRLSPVEKVIAGSLVVVAAIGIILIADGLLADLL